MAEWWKWLARAADVVALSPSEWGKEGLKTVGVLLMSTGVGWALSFFSGLDFAYRLVLAALCLAIIVWAVEHGARAYWIFRSPTSAVASWDTAPAQDLQRRIRAIEERLDAPPKLVLVARTDGVVITKLGHREIELDTAAWDYYQTQLDDHHRDTILRMIQNRVTKSRWDRHSFVMAVDLKARIRWSLDEFLGEGNRHLVSARKFAALPPPPPPIHRQGLGDIGRIGLPRIPSYDEMMLSSYVRQWETSVYKFLKDETDGHAEEFMSDVPPPAADTPEMVALAARLDALVRRLAIIKARIG